MSAAEKESSGTSSGPTVVTATPGFKELLKQSLKELVEESPGLFGQLLQQPAHRGECSKVVKQWGVSVITQVFTGSGIGVLRTRAETVGEASRCIQEG